MLPTAHIAHHAGERLRLRIPSRKGDAAYFTRAEQALATCAGVAYAEANPLTASVLLHYYGDLDDLVAAAATHNLFTLEPPQPPTASVLDIVADRVDRIEQLVAQRSHGSLDLETLLFAGLVGASVVQLARGRVLGPTSTLLANAATILAAYRTRRAGRQ